MSYLLDTCVVSEMVKPRPFQAVVDWLTVQRESTLYLSVITLGELTRGIVRLPASGRRDRLQLWVDVELTERFRGRWLPVDGQTATVWGKLLARSEEAGLRLPAVDTLLAASALSRDLCLVTRNVRHFEATGVRCLNPWDS